MNRLEFEKRYTSSLVKVEKENISTNESKFVDLVVTNKMVSLKFKKRIAAKINERGTG